MKISILNFTTTLLQAVADCFFFQKQGGGKDPTHKRKGQDTENPVSKSTKLEGEGGSSIGYGKKLDSKLHNLLTKVCFFYSQICTLLLLITTPSNYNIVYRYVVSFYCHITFPSCNCAHTMPSITHFSFNLFDIFQKFSTLMMMLLL